MAEPSSQSRTGGSWVFWWRLNFSLAGKVLSHIIWPPQLKCLLEDLSCPQQYHRQERGHTAQELPVPGESVQLHPWVEAEQQELTGSCKTSKAAVRGCPQHTVINGQGRAGWPQDSLLQGTDMLKGTEHILCRMEVHLHPLIAPEVVTLLTVTPKGLLQPREVERRGGEPVVSGKSVSGLSKFFGRADNF